MSTSCSRSPRDQDDDRVVAELLLEVLGRRNAAESLSTSWSVPASGSSRSAAIAADHRDQQHRDDHRHGVSTHQPAIRAKRSLTGAKAYGRAAAPGARV